MTFSDAIKVCFRKYATFSGRATRSECWWFVLFLLLAGTVSGMIDNAIYGDDLIETYVIDELTYATVNTTGPFQSIFWLLTVLPFLATGWRRMHDTGRSGLYLLCPVGALIGLVTFVGIFSGLEVQAMIERSIFAFIVVSALVIIALSPFLVLWWLTRPSQPVPNQYGPNPYEVTP